LEHRCAFRINIEDIEISVIGIFLEEDVGDKVESERRMNAKPFSRAYPFQMIEHGCLFVVVLWFLDKGNGVRRDSFFPTYKSHTLGSSGFYRNIVNFGMENVGQCLLHERYCEDSA
jgi:hypothetical protein